MPKEMLMEMASKLKEMASSLEGYAGEDMEEGGEEESMPSPSSEKESYGGGDAKVKMAISAIKSKMNK